MKKLLCALLALLAALSLCACTAAAPEGSLSIRQSELTQEERDIVSLLGGGRQGSVLYDFTLDDSIRAVRVERYELTEEGAWRAIGGGSFAVRSGGRFALTLDPAAGTTRLAVQDEHGTSAIQSTYPEESYAGMSVATSLAADKELRFAPGQEVPLAVQIITSKPETVSYDTEYFFHPEEYLQYGYEHIYAVTATFSGDALN